MDTRASRLGRFLFTEADPSRATMVQSMAGYRMKPGIERAGAMAVMGGLIGVSALRTRFRQPPPRDYGLVDVPRYEYDGIAGGDPTLGARGDMVFGMRNMARR